MQLVNIFGPLARLLNKKEVEIVPTDTSDSAGTSLEVQRFAVNVVVNLIAGLISKCEIKTYYGGKEIKQNDYYKWNISPNDNQTGPELMQKLVKKLLYTGKALIVEGGSNIYVADSYSENDNVLTPIEFTQVSVGSFTFTQKTFNTRNSIFITLDDDNIAKYLNSLLQQYDKLLSNSAKKFIQHGGRKGIAKLPSVTQGDDKKKEQIDNFFNKTLKNYFKAENAVATVPNGIEYTEQPANGEKRSTSEAVDIKTLTCEALSQAARAFGMPPSLVLGEVADASKALDLALTSAIEPIVKIIVTAINRIAYTKEEYLNGAYLQIDIRCIKHIDIFSVAQAVDKLISDGIYSVDEVRVLLGDSPIGEAWSKKHFMTKNYSEISGGEKKNE